MAGHEAVLTAYLRVRVWTAESHELGRHKPVEVAILDLLVVLILLTIEVVKVEESSLFGFAHSVQTVEDGDGIHRNSERSIPVENKY